MFDFMVSFPSKGRQPNNIDCNTAILTATPFISVFAKYSTSNLMDCIVLVSIPDYKCTLSLVKESFFNPLELNAVQAQLGL